VARRRAQWAKYQNKIAPERLVFIDETAMAAWACDVSRKKSLHAEFASTASTLGRSITSSCALRKKR
jgi:hypothetical protein